MAVKIITDSGCDLSTAQAAELDIILVPMTVRFGQEEFRSGLDITNEEFYDRLIQSNDLPTTSQPTPYDFSRAYQEVTDNGDEAVVLCISSALSGTYQSAVIAAGDFEKDIHVVDSRAVSVMQRLLLEYAIYLRAQNCSAAQIAEKLERKKQYIRAFAIVDTLEYLIKGGRLSKAAGTVGSMLGIRPVLTLKEGALEIAGKARGAKGAIAMANKFINSLSIDFSMPVALGYTGCDSSVVEPYLNAELSPWDGRDLPIYQVGSTVGTHAGPGLILITFFEKS